MAYDKRREGRKRTDTSDTVWPAAPRLIGYGLKPMPDTSDTVWRAAPRLIGYGLKPMRLRVLGIELAGGKGTRLYPLTKERAKPAVPFGGKYRIIDFVLSNFINSGIYSIYVLTQFKSQSLLQHLSEGWQFGGLLKTQFII